MTAEADPELQYLSNHVLSHEGVAGVGADAQK